jgi:endonuclease YncB( thermonuclease family)
MYFFCFVAGLFSSIIINICVENNDTTKEYKTKSAKIATTPFQESLTKAKMTRSIDGDTIEVRITNNREVIKVRLIGVDTPEMKSNSHRPEYMAEEAKIYTETFTYNKNLYLEFGDKKTDMFGRTLAYVYDENGDCLNLNLIRYGYALAYTKFNFKHRSEYIKEECVAKDKGIGLWSKNK